MGVTWKDGEWHVEGEPPNGLQIINGTWLGRAGEEAPECFGVLWDGIKEEECRSKCDFSPPCLELTAKQALIAAQIRLGAGHNLEGLAVDMNVPEETVLALMAYSKGGPSPLAKKATKKTPPISEPKAAPEPVAVDTPQVDEGTIPPKENKVATPKKKKAPAAKEAKPKSAGPQKAQSAKRAKAGAKVKVGTTAKPVTARAAPTHTAPNHWGEHTFQERCERERQRSPLIAKLKPGIVLKTTYKGQKCEVKVLKLGYKVQDQVVPTLYMAALTYVGVAERPKPGQEGKATRKVSDYSAAKFWKLQALFGEAPKPKSNGKAQAKAKPQAKAALKKLNPSQRARVAPKVQDAVEQPLLPAPASEGPPPLPPEASKDS